MKYIKVERDMLWGTDAITRDDLVRVRNRTYDTIINLDDLTQYDAENNTWKSIPHQTL